MITYSKFGLNGRLGNQMFQLATVYSLSKKLDTKCFLFLRSNQNASNFETIDDLLEFDIKNNDQLVWIDDLGTYKKTYFEQITKNYSEPTFCYSETFETIQDKTDVIGFFQTERYFGKHKNEIKDLFKLKNESERFKEYKSLIEEMKPTSLHIRRGDYVGKSNFHNSLADTLYYYTSVQEFKKVDPNRKFLVFSDDLEFCKTYFEKYLDEYLDDFHYVSGTTGPEEIILQSFCRGNIIANSSFSWWGAYLNKDERNLVFCPQNWFGPDGPKDTHDIYCEGWIRV